MKSFSEEWRKYPGVAYVALVLMGLYGFAIYLQGLLPLFNYLATLTVVVVFIDVAYKMLKKENDILNARVESLEKMMRKENDILEARVESLEKMMSKDN